MKIGDILNSKANLNNNKKDNYKYISELKKDDEIVSIYRIASKRMQVSKDGKKFLLLTLSDKTGVIRAIDWHNAELNDNKVSVGDVVKVEGKIVIFENRLQLNISKNSMLRVLDESEYDHERFIETSKRDIEKMYQELVGIIKNIKNKYLKSLLERIFVQDRNFLELFLKAPAAVSIHHVYKGGLLEHTLDVVEVCSKVAEKYSEVIDSDLLITGAILHDIGKAYEYEITSSGINVTDKGELLGHISIGVNIVERVVKEIKGFPEELLIEVKHMILSHHGEFEWGSPVLPKTPEALVLHMIDNLDAKISQFLRLTEKGEPGGWSEYDRRLGRRIMIRGERK